MRALLIIAVIEIGCSGAAPKPEAAATAVAPDGGALQPGTFAYKGLHSGDHPPWAYQQTVTIAAADRAGRAVWRRTASFGTDAAVSMMVEVDRRTLAPVYSELGWNGSTVRVDFSPGQTVARVDDKGAQRTVTNQHQEPVVYYDVLDLYVASLPLAPGYQARVALLDFWLLTEPTRYVVRDFTIRVTKEDIVTVPAGAIPVYVVAVDPTDGNDRLKSTFHVVKTRPHYAARMEYVVNPANVGEEKRSVGVDELLALPR